MELNKEAIDAIGKRIEWYKNLRPEEKLLGNRGLAGGIAQDDLAKLYDLAQLLIQERSDLQAELAAAKEEMERLKEENRQLNKEGLADALAEECELTAYLQAQLDSLREVAKVAMDLRAVSQSGIQPEQIVTVVSPDAMRRLRNALSSHESKWGKS